MQAAARGVVKSAGALPKPAQSGASGSDFQPCLKEVCSLCGKDDHLLQRAFGLLQTRDCRRREGGAARQVSRRRGGRSLTRAQRGTEVFSGANGCGREVLAISPCYAGRFVEDLSFNHPFQAPNLLRLLIGG